MEPQLHAQVGTEVPINHFPCTLCQVSGFSVIEYHSRVEKYYVASREIVHAVRNLVYTSRDQDSTESLNFTAIMPSVSVF